MFKVMGGYWFTLYDISARIIGIPRFQRKNKKTRRAALAMTSSVTVKVSANIHRSAGNTAMNVVDGDLAGPVMRFKNGTSRVTAELESERYWVAGPSKGSRDGENLRTIRALPCLFVFTSTRHLAPLWSHSMKASCNKNGLFLGCRSAHSRIITSSLTSGCTRGLSPRANRITRRWGMNHG